MEFDPMPQPESNRVDAMPTDTRAAKPERSSRHEAQPDGIGQTMLPGMLVSVVIHVVILVVASTTLRGCQRGIPAEAGGDHFRDVGLKLVSDSSNDTDIPDQIDSDTQQPAMQQTTQIVAESVPDEAPSLDELLNDPPSDVNNLLTETDLPPVIGAGTHAGSTNGAETSIPEIIQPGGASGQSATGSPTPGPNAASFMQIADSGEKFVYLIDTSSSMGEGNRLNLAKSELKASLNRLKPHQRFQIIFYNKFPSRINLRRRPFEPFYPATIINLQLASDAIDSVYFDSGTEHVPALLDAMKYEADVVYFLTDGREPSLSRQEIQLVRRSNRSGAHIHVIEFGIGLRESRHGGWLQDLAELSGGQYRFWGPSTTSDQ